MMQALNWHRSSSTNHGECAGDLPPPRDGDGKLATSEHLEGSVIARERAGGPTAPLKRARNELCLAYLRPRVSGVVVAPPRSSSAKPNGKQMTW